MATVEDLLAAIKHVNDCAGDPQAWRTGLTPQEITDVATVYVATPQRLDALLGTIRSRHPDLFESHQPGGVPQAGPPVDGRPTDHQEGDAADAIRSAESALAQQSSSTAQLDLQVVSAILNAHLTAVDGKEALNRLQADVESAVRTRTDLDTAAGARDFRRFLLGKLKDIRAVIADASLDDTSKSALMAALTSLYSASEESHSEPPPPSAAPVVSAPAAPRDDSAEPEDVESDPYLEPSLDDDDDSDVFPADSPPQAPAPTPSAALPSLPAAAGFPPFVGAAPPGPMPGWGASGGSPIPDLLEALGKHGAPDDDLEAALERDDPGSYDDVSSDDDDDDDDDAGAEPTGEPAGPTQVALPNGETVTAADPKLAAVIESAVNGTPIADAFREQGITIPPPGTAVTDRIDPPQLSPGDVGMFTDHHALSLGPGEALVNGQIQHISTVQGPSFLGWEHPPAPVPTAAPSKSDPPTPTRPAALATA